MLVSLREIHKYHNYPSNTAMPLPSEITVKETFLKACQGNELNKVRSVLIFDADTIEIG